jgi:outer membrane receptor protein involved in Fe transport
MYSPNKASYSSKGQVDTVVAVDNNEVHTTLYYGANFNIQHQFKPDEKLVFNADYLHYKDKNPNTYYNSYYMPTGGLLYEELVKSDKITPLEFMVLSLDYNRKLSKKVELEAGLKATSSHSTNTVMVSTLEQSDWVTDSLLSGVHYIREKIGAAYTSFNWRISDKTSFKGGLRYEYTHTRIDSDARKNEVARDYGNLFPSFFFMHNIREDRSLNFSYSKRIWRPSYSNLAPYVIFLDPKTFQTGNPALQPSIIDALSASFTYKTKIITLSYDHIGNAISEIPRVDEASNRMITAVQNTRGVQGFSLQFNVPVKVNSWWNMQNYISGFWREVIAFYKEEVRSEILGFYANTTQNFILPKDYSVSISAYYNSGGAWGLYRFRAMGSMDIGFQKKLTKSRSTLALNFSNILNSQKANLTANLPDQNLLIKNVYIYSYPVVNLSFSKNFGNDKVQGKRDRSTGAEEEKGRAN